MGTGQWLQLRAEEATLYKVRLCRAFLISHAKRPLRLYSQRWLCDFAYLSLKCKEFAERSWVGSRLTRLGSRASQGVSCVNRKGTKSSCDHGSSRTFLNRPLFQSKSLAREYGLVKPLGCFPSYFRHDVQETRISQMVLPNYGSFSPWEGLGKLFLLPPALHPQVLLLFSLPVYGG